MFRRNRYSPPARPFSHASDCRLLAADPGLSIEWNEFERGHWVRTCVCGEEHHRAPASPRVRLDPYDPATFRHGGGCEMREVTEPSVLRALLKIMEREDYWWVQCGSCDFGWQVPFFVEESVG